MLTGPGGSRKEAAKLAGMWAAVLPQYPDPTATSPPSVPFASALPSVSGEATPPACGRRTGPRARSRHRAVFSKTALAYCCNISILQSQGPREALGQRSGGVNNPLSLPLPFIFLLFLGLLFTFEWPHRGGWHPSLTSLLSLMPSWHSWLSHKPPPFRPAPSLCRNLLVEAQKLS